MMSICEKISNMKPETPILIEACVNSTTSALAAQRGGAGRVELCDNLHEGGTTPSLGSIAAARRHLNIQLFVMIRPRGGDFLYSDLEFEIMREDVLRAKEAGADGVVFGILNPDGTIDAGRCTELAGLSAPLGVTFHRAFDMTADPFTALEDLMRLGIERVLTSGQRPSAPEGIDLIAELVDRAHNRITIMPGVSIDATNIAEIIDQTGAREYHVLAERTVQSGMTFRNSRVFMGGDPDMSEYHIRQTDPDRIRDICAAAGGVKSRRM